MDDVIGQGREPERDPRPPLPRSWRIAAGTTVVVAAGIAVAVLAPRHAATAPGMAPGVTPTPTVAATAVAGAPTPVPALSGFPLPLPQNNPVILVCAPSTGVCSTRMNVRAITVRPGGR